MVIARQIFVVGFTSEKKIGIREAYPVLVNTDMRHELDQFLPSNEVFNHCIVKFTFNDTTYWVDPTYTQQGGDFKDLVTLDYGKALIVGALSDTLVQMPQCNKNSKTKIVDEFFINSFSEPASLKVKSIRYGAEADARRVFLEQYTLNDISKSTLDELRKFFPGAENAADVRINDDMNKNELSTDYEYRIDNTWMDGNKMSDNKTAGYWLFRFEPQVMYQYINARACAERRFDYDEAYPLNLTYYVIFHFPKDLMIIDDYKEYDNISFFCNEKTEQLDRNSILITYQYSTKAPFVKAADYKKVCEQKNAIVKAMPQVIYFNK